MLKHLDLFSGIGGFALAVKWVGGIETVAFSEIDPFCCKVLEKNFPGIKNYGDVRNVTEKEAWLVTGGFPCQPFSVAGRKRGKNDDRYIWPEMFRVIQQTKPTWIICENAFNFVNMELEQTLIDLESEGYETQTFVIPAVGVEAPHRRSRVWVVGHTCCCRFSGQHRWWSEQKPTDGCENVANTNIKGLEGWKEYWKSKEELLTRKVSGSKPAIWKPEPELGRVANGIPNRVDRLKGLGNSIVPQLAQVLIQTIKDIEDENI